MNRFWSRHDPLWALLLVLLPPLASVNGEVCAQVGEPRRVEILPPSRVRTPPPPRGVARDLADRPRQEIAIPAAGPASSELRPEQRVITDDAVSLPAAARVYDRDGRPIPGARRIGPGRVIDPRTGRHLDVRARGGDLQVVPGG